MSSNKHALIQDMIPYIDILTEHIEKFKADPTVSRMVRAAAAHGCIILDLYYSHTDNVAIYCIAMSTSSTLVQHVAPANFFWNSQCFTWHSRPPTSGSTTGLRSGLTRRSVSSMRSGRTSTVPRFVRPPRLLIVFLCPSGHVALATSARNGLASPHQRYISIPIPNIDIGLAF